MMNDILKFRLLFLNMQIILLVLCQVLAIFVLLAVTEIIPINITALVSYTIQSVIHTSANLVLTRGEIINSGLIMLIGGQIWLNQVYSERRELMYGIDIEGAMDELKYINKDTL